MAVAAEDVGPLKAVILARGLGTRLRAEGGGSLDASQRSIADQGVKALMPVGRPLLDHALGRLADAGLTEICLVIGPEHTIIREHVARLPLKRIRVSFVEQATPKGTADAVLAAEAFVGRDEFVVVNGDNLYPVDALKIVQEFEGQRLVAFAANALVTQGNMRPERVGRFPEVKFTTDFELTELVERDRAPGPGNGLDEYISMNLWAFTPSIFAACRAVKPSLRGELEVTEAARVAMGNGEKFQAIPMSAPVLDLTDRADIPALQLHLTGAKVRL